MAVQVTIPSNSVYYVLQSANIIVPYIQPYEKIEVVNLFACVVYGRFMTIKKSLLTATYYVKNVLEEDFRRKKFPPNNRPGPFQFPSEEDRMRFELAAMASEERKDEIISYNAALFFYSLVGKLYNFDGFFNNEIEQRLYQQYVTHLWPVWKISALPQHIQDAMIIMDNYAFFNNEVLKIDAN